MNNMANVTAGDVIFLIFCFSLIIYGSLVVHYSRKSINMKINNIDEEKDEE